MNMITNNSNRNISSFRTMRKAMDNESGAVLVIVLLILLVLAGLVPAAVNMSRNDFTRTVSYEEGKESFYIADAGVNKAKSLLAGTYKDTVLDNADTNSGIIDRSGTIVTKNGKKYNEVSYGGGKYWFRLDDNVEADGDLTKDNDNITTITSIGQVDNGPEKTITATTYKLDLPPTTFPSALTMVGPSSILNASGNGFTVNGSDPAGNYGLALDGTTPDPNCPGQNAVAFESSGTDPIEMKNKLNTTASKCTDATTNTCIVSNNGANLPNFVGVGDQTNGDFVTSQTDLTSTMAGDLYDAITADLDGDNTADLASSTTDCGGPCHVTANSSFSGGTWGSASNPVMAFFEGDVSFTGNFHGYGILIINGDLNIAGTFQWDGVVLVGVCDTCSSTTDDASGTGSGSINGAFVVGNGTQAQVDITGSFDVNYSCAGIGIANTVLGGSVSVLAWNEQGA